MLFRMYQRYAQNNGYGFEVISYEEADEAGIKSCLVAIKGDMAYGYLKGESGVHRLVRISPFDSSNRRHTSFASVEVLPEFNNEIEIEIRDEDGEIVQHLERDDYSGSKCILFTPKQDAIWSFRCLNDSVNLKFYAPLPGIWADDPSYLPTYGEDLPFKRIKKEYSSVPELPTARLFPLPVKGAVAKAVDAAAAARAEFGAGDKWAKLYKQRRYHYDWTEPAAQTQEQLKVAAMELEALEPIRKMRDMELNAGRESEDLRRYVAFVSLYAPVLALDDAEAKKFALAPALPADEDFRLKVNAFISRYGAEYIEDGFFYDDYSAVMKLAPFIIDRLEALQVNK